MCDDFLFRMGKFCGGFIWDFKRWFFFYLSDFKDVLDVYCLLIIIFVYFVCFVFVIIFGGLLSEKINVWMGVLEMIFVIVLLGVLFGFFVG